MAAGKAVHKSILPIEEAQESSYVNKTREKHALEFYLSFYKGKEIISVVMYGDTLHISALSKSINTTELDIRLYKEDPENPPSRETVDELFSELKAFISEIPNVTITEEK